MHSIAVETFSQWRCHARSLMANSIRPDQVHWSTAKQHNLFEDYHLTTAGKGNSRLTVPKHFMSLASKAACFEDKTHPSRKWSILYSLLWRLSHEHRDVLQLQSDSQVSALFAMVKSVNRDMHKMKAFVRFQTDQSCQQVLGAPQGTEAAYYTAWFEPDHAIVAATAPFFAKRFTGMHWSILTPHGCAHWDKRTLRLSPGTTRPALTEDEFELFWKAYYCRIFNPARLKEKAMMAEMPKKYWQYLPEARCIKELTRQSAARTDDMIDAALTDPEKVRRKSHAVVRYQNDLRDKNRV